MPPGCTICSSPTLHTSWSVIRAKITWEKLYGRDLSAKEIVREGKIGVPASGRELVCLLDRDSPKNESDPVSLKE